MKKYFFAIFWLVQAFLLYAQEIEPELIFEEPLGSNVTSDSLHFSTGVYRGESPADIAFMDGRRLWISETDRAVVIDIAAHDKIQYQVMFPNGPVSFVDRDNYSFGDRWSLAAGGLFLTFDQDFKKIDNTTAIGNDSDFDLTRPMVRGDAGYYFLRNHTIVKVSKDHRVFSPAETQTELLERVNRFWGNGRTQQRNSLVSLVERGDVFIVDGIVFPRTDKAMFEFFSSFSKSLPETSSEGANPVVDVSFNGDVYIPASNDRILIYDQNSQLLTSINLGSLRNNYKRRGNPQFIGPVVAIHPNGDLYCVFAIEGDKEYFYKVKKTWGTDYISLAKTGIATSEVAKTKSLLSNFNNPELRILRNAFFALRGYDFQSWDLKSYFNGYDWYEPKPEVKADPATLNSDQRRLFDLVVAEESRRK